MTAFLMLFGLSMLAGLVATAIVWPTLWAFGVFQKPALVQRLIDEIGSAFSTPPTIKPQS
jgi:hypothetical protein